MSVERPSNGPPSMRTKIVGPREAARVTGDAPGPTLIAVGGIHGNEPGGVAGALRVAGRLSLDDVDLRGELVIFRGNMGALAEKKRFRVRDLNRVWHDEELAALEGRPLRELDAEAIEALELLDAIGNTIARARGPVFLVDLHTTSADGVPFAISGGSPEQRRFVGALPLPVVMGLEERITGVLAEYWTRRGCTTFSVEGGQHDDPSSIDNLEATMLLAAESAGLFAEGSIAETRDAYALLEQRRGALPRIMQVVDRHAIGPEDDFSMEPGFRNLDHARQGQLLARDKKGEIRARSDGLVILPLYQKQGTDGFFWGRSLDA